MRIVKQHRANNKHWSNWLLSVLWFTTIRGCSFCVENRTDYAALGGTFPEQLLTTKTLIAISPCYMKIRMLLVKVLIINLRFGHRNLSQSGWQLHDLDGKFPHNNWWKIFEIHFVLSFGSYASSAAVHFWQNHGSQSPSHPIKFSLLLFI